jgi:hypothetical protein
LIFMAPETRERKSETDTSQGPRDRARAHMDESPRGEREHIDIKISPEGRARFQQARARHMDETPRGVDPETERQDLTNQDELTDKDRSRLSRARAQYLDETFTVVERPGEGTHACVTATSRERACESSSNHDAENRQRGERSSEQDREPNYEDKQRASNFEHLLGQSEDDKGIIKVSFNGKTLNLGRTENGHYQVYQKIEGQGDFDVHEFDENGVYLGSSNGKENKTDSRNSLIISSMLNQAIDLQKLGEPVTIRRILKEDFDLTPTQPAQEEASPQIHGSPTAPSSPSRPQQQQTAPQAQPQQPQNPSTTPAPTQPQTPDPAQTARMQTAMNAAKEAEATLDEIVTFAKEYQARMQTTTSLPQMTESEQTNLVAKIDRFNALRSEFEKSLTPEEFANLNTTWEPLSQTLTGIRNQIDQYGSFFRDSDYNGPGHERAREAVNTGINQSEGQTLSLLNQLREIQRSGTLVALW